MKTVDAVVIGGGLAGCAMVWQCRMRGLRAVLIDQPQPDAASRVAAGLVTPMTGSRLAISWRWAEFFPAADTLYRLAEKETGRNFWVEAPDWRAFLSEKESEFCRQRWFQPAELGDRHGDLLQQSGVQVGWLEPSGLPPSIAHFGGIRMEPAARLDTNAYLDATRQMLERDGMLVSMDLDVDGALCPFERRIEIPSFGLTARWVVLCQGMRARSNRWFASLPLHPARGDILRIRSRRFHLKTVLHHEGWVVPLGEDQFLFGATYDRQALQTSLVDPVAARWRETLERRWERMTGEAIGTPGAETLEHRIAVRPASYDRHPLIGQHPEHPQLFCLNGLGSKGSLMAPWVASHLLDAMLGREPVESCLRWDRAGR